MIAVLAGTSMAAGWWLFQGRSIRTAPPVPAVTPAVAQAQPDREPVPVATVATEPTSAPTPSPKASDKPRPAERPTDPAPPRRTPPPAPPATALTFQKDILPIFQAKCVTCHGANDKRKGGLDLRTAAALRKGGESGPTVVRGDPEKSLLWETIANDQMPPNKNKLSSAEKAKLRQWIANGQ